MQVRRRYARGVELLYLPHDVRHLLVRHHQPFLKTQIVHQLLHRPPQIPVVVDVANHPFRDMPLRLAHLRQIHLRFQLFQQARPARNGNVRRPLSAVVRPLSVACTIHILRRLIVAHILLVVEVLVLQSVLVAVFARVLIPLIRPIVCSLIAPLPLVCTLIPAVLPVLRSPAFLLIASFFQCGILL